MTKLIAAVSVGLFLFSACAVGPDYTRPRLDTPPSWRLEEKEAKDVTNTRWWEQFADPVLNNLITEAIRENNDVRIAYARVEEFLGRYRTSRAAFFPQVSAGV